MNEFEIKSGETGTDSADNTDYQVTHMHIQKRPEQQTRYHPAYPVRTHAHKKTFMQRNKYRIRQICGIAVLAGIITAAALLFSKCGSNIDDASSAVKAGVSANRGTSSRSESSSETSTTSQTTTTDSTAATAQQTVTPEPRPTGDPIIEVKNGLTYVNGILIANKTYPVPSTYNPGLDPEAQAAFSKMQQAAAAQGIYLWICSGFRSYSYQGQLYNGYVEVDGKAAADRYSARPGHSEHQTGLAMDINYASSWFDNTPEAAWLAEHCSDFGFIIRYKAGKESSTGYMAESWHIRYLGDISLCKSIEASGLSLEEYLGITSVYANP